MPKGKGDKGTKLTLKNAKKAIRTTPDGRRRLILSNMGFAVFPKCLLKLTDLDELDLSRNQLEQLPDNLGNLTTLRWLDLHSNKLESIPETICNLVGLTHLNVCNNRITSAGLPQSLGYLTCLKSLNLGMNKLDRLPVTMEALGDLQELGLFDNLFAKLPEFVIALSSYAKVNVKRNPVSFAQGDGVRVVKKKLEPEEDMYVVYENSLCRTCLKRCKENIGERGGGGGGGDMVEDKRIRTYPGLMAPNSVATVDQDVWRIRKMEH